MVLNIYIVHVSFLILPKCYMRDRGIFYINKRVNIRKYKYFTFDLCTVLKGCMLLIGNTPGCSRSISGSYPGKYCMYMKYKLRTESGPTNPWEHKELLKNIFLNRGHRAQRTNQHLFYRLKVAVKQMPISALLKQHFTKTNKKESTGKFQVKYTVLLKDVGLNLISTNRKQRKLRILIKSYLLEC